MPIHKIKYRLVVFTVFVAALISACDEPSDFGMDLLPSDDLISVNTTEDKNSVSAFTRLEEQIRTDEPSTSLLGVFDDPVFGTTTVDFATQFQIQAFPDYGENPQIDSVNLYLYYRRIYGDTITPQTLRVYELVEPIFADSVGADGYDYNYPYYQDVDLKSKASTQILGETVIIPNAIIADSVTNTITSSDYELITIPLDISVGEKLLQADSSQITNNENFLEYFKGLYIESVEESNEGGAILSLATTSSSSFRGSAIAVYYNNDENRNAEEPDTLLMPYVVSPSSARVNSITHDYSGTAFYNKLDNETGPDSLIYLQSTGGLEAEVFIDEISQWRDSVLVRGNETIPYAINKAELVFQIDTVISEVEKYPPPSQLLFTAVDQDGEQSLPNDYFFDPAFYGGILNTEDYTYRFNVTQHFQQIIEGEIENNGFYLTTISKNSEANRVVLKGSESATGIKLNITYTKFEQ